MLLDGIVVLEAAGFVPGPLAGQILADLGARVIKIEPIGSGDSLRAINPGGFKNLNRGKESLAIDLKHATGRKLLGQLVTKVDAAIVSYRPSASLRLGLDETTLRGANPTLLYCSVTGYGASGPYADWSGHDINYLAIAGVLALSGDQGQPNVGTQFPIADTLAGVYCALTILAGYIGRLKGETAGVFDLSMTETLLQGVALRLNEYRGGEPKLSGLGRRRPGYGVYRTRDGLFLALACREDVYWRRLCEVLPIEEWRNDLSLSSWEGRLKHVDQIDERLSKIFGQQTRDHWLKLFIQNGMPASPANTLDNVLDEPQLCVRGALTEPSDRTPETRRVRAAFPALIDGTRPMASAEAPRLGADSEAIARWLGYSSEGLNELIVERILQVANRTETNGS